MNGAALTTVAQRLELQKITKTDVRRDYQYVSLWCLLAISVKSGLLKNLCCVYVLCAEMQLVYCPTHGVVTTTCGSSWSSSQVCCVLPERKAVLPSLQSIKFLLTGAPTAGGSSGQNYQPALGDNQVRRTYLFPVDESEFCSKD